MHVCSGRVCACTQPCACNTGCTAHVSGCSQDAGGRIAMSEQRRDVRHITAATISADHKWMAVAEAMSNNQAPQVRGTRGRVRNQPNHAVAQRVVVEVAHAANVTCTSCTPHRNPSFIATVVMKASMTGADLHFCRLPCWTWPMACSVASACKAPQPRTSLVLRSQRTDW